MFAFVRVDRLRAKLVMLKTPQVFSKLIDRFDGAKLPTADTIKNILSREFKVSTTWQPRVASMFLNSLEAAGVVDSAGFLRFKTSLNRPHGAKVGGMTAPAPSFSAEASFTPPPQTGVTNESRISPADVDVWSFKIGNQVVRLETSNELSMAAWKKLAQYVEVLRPEEGN